jgi:hypothetical protein
VVASLSPEKALASSVSSAAAIYPASPLCRVREDSFFVVAGPLLLFASPVMEEALAMTDWNLSLAKGMIRLGFLCPRIASPFLLAIISLASSVKADKNPSPAKDLICLGFLGLSSASPSIQGSKMDIVEP